MRGRKPKPTIMKLIAGNPGKRPLNENEPMPESSKDAPTAPKYLCKVAAGHWDTMAKQLHPLGLLTNADMDALARYCDLYARWLEAQSQLKDHGLLIKAQNGFPIQSPYIAISNKCTELMNRIGIEFGLTPSSRGRISVDKPQKASRVSGLARKV